jgi:clan AA aspartic protease
VIDNGYEGFLAVPMDVFEQLELNDFQQERTLVLADGTALTSKGAYGTLAVHNLRVKLSGFIETYHGLEEIILGVEALSHFKATLDYCSKKLILDPCP